MRLNLCFLWASIIAYAAAAGLRVGYEKVFLYYAWKIDQTNPEAQRTVGVRCSEPIHPVEGGCKDPPPPTKTNELQKPKYIPCEYVDKTYDRILGKLVVSTKPCVTLRHFVSHIDDKDWNNNVPIPGGQQEQTIEAPDVDETAMNIGRRGMDQNRYPPWRVIKDGTSFNRMIEDIGNVIIQRKRTMTPDELAANKQFFDGAERAMEGIKLQRQADHHRYLLPDLKAALNGVDIKTDEVVINSGGEKGQVLNFQKTIDNNEPDTREKLEKWLQNHYETKQTAREHKIVMDSFEVALNKIRDTSCSST